MRLAHGLAGALFVLLLAFVAPAKADNGPGITAVFQGTNQQLEVFWVDATGAVRDVYKDNNHLWHQPFSMTGPGAAPPGAHLTAVQQVQDDQLQLYWVGGDGALTIMWKSHNNAWQGPTKWSEPGFAMPGSPVTAVWQPVRHEMHIFGLAADGHLNFKYNKDLKWAGFFPLSAPNFGVAGAQISAVYEPEGEALEVFAAGPDGSINNAWKNADGKWNTSQLARPGTVPHGGAISATYTPFRSKAVVMWLDEHGAYNTLTKPDNKWTTATVSRAGWGLPGAPLSAVYQPVGSHVESFTAASDGSVVDSWKTGDADWAPPINLTRPGIAPPGATIVGVYQPLNQQLEVFWIDAVGTVWDVWKKNNGAWEQPAPLTSIGGTAFITPGMCTRFLAGYRRLGRNYHDSIAGLFDEYKLVECENIMGITASCAAKDGTVYEDFDDDRGVTRHFLICAHNYHPEDAEQQILHIGVGVSQGIGTAFVAASPYLGPIVEGVSCATGVVYACAVLALDIADRVGALDEVGIDSKVASTALSFASRAAGCVDGNVVACAELGSQALGAAAGTSIPGGDIARAIELGDKCRDGDFAACARLGQMATDAAGVKVSVDQIFGGAADGAECLDSLDDDARSSRACRELGIQAAKAALAASKLDKTNMFNSIADRAQQCVDNSDPQACLDIGLSAAKAAGVPLPLNDRVLQQGTDCVVGKNKDACVAIGAAVAKASGVPLDNPDFLRRCANGEDQICAILASQTVGLPLAKIDDIKKVAISVSNCVNANAQECQALATAAITRYYPDLASKIGVASGVADKSGLQIAQASNTLGWLPPKSTPPPAPPPPVVSAIPAAPQPAAGATFAGRWVTTVQNGVAYTITFTQDPAGRVSGQYDAGTISDGVVVGSDLYAHWKQGSAAGTLLFSLAADRAAFAGLWTLGEKAPSPASASGTWDGYRTDVFTGTANPGSFVGTWTVTRGIVGFPVELQANGASITAAYNTGFAKGTLSGTAIRQYAKTDVLSFTWDEQQSKGAGAFYLYPDGTRISGILHTSDKALGTWTAVRAAPVVAMQPPPVVQEPPPMVQAPPATQPPPVAQAPVIKIPRGACPGPEAVATQAVNVHDGIKGATLKPPLDGGALVSCLACDQSWCLIANANPHATVSRQFLDFDYAVAQAPPPPAPEVQPVQPTPPPAPEIADFSGDWNVVTSTGVIYHMTINQLKEIVSGTLVDQTGRQGGVNGGIGGRVMGLSIVLNGGGPGSGQFALAPDGNSMDGGFQLAPMPNQQPYALAGSWHGTRGFQPFPMPAPVAQAPDPMGGVDSQIDYGGCGGCGKTRPDVPDVVR